MSGLSVLGFVDGLKAQAGKTGGRNRGELSSGRSTPSSDRQLGFMWRLARLLKQRGHRAGRIG
jgi:hypothetical protein